MKTQLTHTCLFLRTKIYLAIVIFSSQGLFAATYTVTNNANTGAGSLRQAITDANANAGIDNIYFNIATTTVTGRTIQPTTALPTITEGVIIDGTTQPTGAAFGVSNAKIIIDGSTSAGTALTVTASNFELYGVWINDYNTYGVYLNGDATDNAIIGTTNKGNVLSGNIGRALFANGSDNLIIQSNIIGLDTNGTAAESFSDRGIYLDNSCYDVLIGGATSDLRNYISGNVFSGVYVYGSADSVVIIGNYIGTSYNGSADLGNGDDGIAIQSGCSRIYVGGEAAGEENIISGNNDNGIRIEADRVVVRGNIIGLDATGAVDIGNTDDGIYIASGADYSEIGSSNAGGGNVISGNNSDGVECHGKRTIFYGNIVGLDISGTVDLGNTWRGILIQDAADSTIVGGAGTYQRNISSGNNNDGIRVEAEHCTIQNNYLGTDITGALDIGNSYRGIYSDAGDSNLIGGNRLLGEGNLISGNGNGEDGITLLTSADYNVIKGNIIGLNAAGTAGISNDVDAIYVGAVNHVTIGGSGAGEGNILSGNVNSGSDGIHLAGTFAATVIGNYIGTDVTGTVDLGNGYRGIFTSGTDSMYVEGNVISGNNWQGIWIESGTNAQVYDNYIGTNAAGTAALGNSRDGIYVEDDSYNITIGASGMGNVVSGNGRPGIYVAGDTVTIKGNYIGVNATATAAIGNTENGIETTTAAHLLVIGGSAVGEGNVISGNGQRGILFYQTDTVVVQGNYIGTNSSGADLGNTLTGITVQAFTTDSCVEYQIGGTGAGEGNTIAYNGGYGILMENGWSNVGFVQRVTVSRNSFFCNSSAGVDLIEGSNSNALTPAITTQTTTNIAGNGVSANAIVELFAYDDGCNQCEGKTYIASTTANGAGSWSFAGSFSGQYVLTSTTTNGATSEFSSCTIDLPIELLDFTAAKDRNNVRLDWSTASELNNSHFVIQRSKDGNSYDDVTVVKGVGNSQQIILYTSYDKNPYSGISYYRLLQEDYDGTQTYFDPVKMDMGYIKTIRLSDNMINDNQNTKIIVEGYEMGDPIQLTIYNYLGAALDFIQFTSGGPDKQQFNLSLSELSSGSYFIRAITEEGMLSLPFYVAGR